jgi:hypothetical protein
MKTGLLSLVVESVSRVISLSQDNKKKNEFQQLLRDEDSTRRRSEGQNVDVHEE